MRTIVLTLIAVFVLLGTLAVSVAQTAPESSDYAIGLNAGDVFRCTNERGCVVMTAEHAMLLAGALEKSRKTCGRWI